MMVSEPAPCPKRFASVGQARTIIVESHIVAMEDTVTSDGQIACLCFPSRGTVVSRAVIHVNG